MPCMGRMKETNRKKVEKASKPSACPAPSRTHCTAPCSRQTAGHRPAPLTTSTCQTVFVTEKNDILLHWKGVFLVMSYFGDYLMLLARQEHKEGSTVFKYIFFTFGCVGFPWPSGYSAGLGNSGSWTSAFKSH